ncbi:MAG: TolC family protein [Alphaproteobacteria bacterium]|nr:TolC family protein [Alphaproteobacteria bacterium]
MDLSSAVEYAVATNPRILEAAANRRAVDQELEEATGAYLPRLDIEGAIGPQMLERPNASNAANLGVWRLSREVSLFARQTVFDGFARANEVYRQEARIDGAAARVMERAEVIGLEAVETYLDVLRHRRISTSRPATSAFTANCWRACAHGSTAAPPPLASCARRKSASPAREAVHADILKAVGAADARFQNVIGREPLKLAWAGLPRGLPPSRRPPWRFARTRHPALQAGGADVNAAEAAFDRTRAPHLPRVDLEGRATIGRTSTARRGRTTTFPFACRCRGTSSTAASTGAAHARGRARHGEQDAARPTSPDGGRDRAAGLVGHFRQRPAACSTEAPEVGRDRGDCHL